MERDILKKERSGKKHRLYYPDSILFFTEYWKPFVYTLRVWGLGSKHKSNDHYHNSLENTFIYRTVFTEFETITLNDIKSFHFLFLSMNFMNKWYCNFTSQCPARQRGPPAAACKLSVNIKTTKTCRWLQINLLAFSRRHF